MNNLFGKLMPIISREDVFEVSIESYHEVYIHNKEGWSKESVFTKKEELLEIVEALKLAFGINDGEVMFSRYLNEIISISVVLPPIAFKGPSLRIFKLPKVAYTLDNYIEWDAIDSHGKELLEKVLSSKSGIICGGTFGSGKTTLFNVLLNSLPSNTSIVSIEPTPDIAFQRERVCRLMPRGSSEREISEVIEAASRMGGDYISLSWMSESWVAPYMELLKANACGITVAAGSSPKNVMDRIQRQAVVSSFGYNLEEAAINITEVFKYLVFQEMNKEDNRIRVTSIEQIGLRSGEIVLQQVYKAS